MIEKVRLGDVCEILNGYAFKSEKYVDSGIRVIRITNVQKGFIEDKEPQFYPLETRCEIEKYMLKSGDLLISLTGNVGRVAVLEDSFLPAALNQRVACLRLKSDTIIKSFVYHLLNSDKFENDCIMSAKGVAQKNMSTEWLKSFEIPILPLKEQRRISSILDKLTDLIDLRKQQLEKLDELVKSRFVEMFGDIIQNDKSWAIYTFSDIASSRLGKMLDTKQQTGEFGYPYLANFNVQWFRFNISNLNKMDFDENDQKEFELLDGDLLVCEGGEIGRCAIWHNEIQPCYFQKALHRVRCDKRIILPDYLAWWFKFNCDYKGFAAIEGAKATIAHLPGAKLKALKVAVPPLELQNQFADFFKQVDKSKAEVQKSLDKLELLKKALMQKYFG